MTTMVEMMMCSVRHDDINDDDDDDDVDNRIDDYVDDDVKDDDDIDDDVDDGVDDDDEDVDDDDDDDSILHSCSPAWYSQSVSDRSYNLYLFSLGFVIPLTIILSSSAASLSAIKTVSYCLWFMVMVMKGLQNLIKRMSEV